MFVGAEEAGGAVGLVEDYADFVDEGEFVDVVAELAGDGEEACSRSRAAPASGGSASWRRFGFLEDVRLAC